MDYTDEERTGLMPAHSSEWQARALCLRYKTGIQKHILAKSDLGHLLSCFLIERGIVQFYLVLVFLR